MSKNEKLKEEISAFTASSQQELELFKSKFTGKKGAIQGLFSQPISEW